MVCDLKAGWWLFLLTLFIFDDTPRVLELRKTGQFFSLSDTAFGPLSPLAVWLSGLIFATLLWWVASGAKRRLSPLDRQLAVLGCLFSLAAAIGLRNLPEWSQAYWRDLRLFVHIFLGYFGITTFFRTASDLKTLMRFFWAAFLTMISAAIVFEAIGFGEPVPGMVRPFFDSSRMLLGVLLVIHASFLLNAPRMKPQGTVFHILVIMTVGTTILLQFTRLHVLLTLLSLIILATVSGWVLDLRSRRMLIGFLRCTRRLVVVVIALILAGSLLVCILISRAPAAWDYLEGRVATILRVFRDPETLGLGSGSADIRWISLVNIWATLIKNKSVLWGQGLGGGFRDDYQPFPLKLYILEGGAAFSPEEARSRHFVRPHGGPLWVLLKMGLMGIIVYYGTAVIMFLKGVKYGLRCKEWRSRALVLGLVSSFPILFWEMIFTTKLTVMFGVVLGILAVLLAQENGLQASSERLSFRRLGV